MDYNNIWVIMPAYNEKNLGKLVKEIRKYTDNIIVVDDGSEKGIYDSIPLEILIQHKKNYGKSTALRTGCDYAFFHRKAKAVILMDADGQHDPAKISEFMIKLRKHDVVFGSRHFQYPMPLLTQFGNWMISKTTNLLFNTDISDILSGYRALTKRAYFKIRWFASGYKVEADMVINTIKKNISHCEIIIPTLYHQKSRMNKREGFKILFHVLKRRFLNEDIVN